MPKITYTGDARAAEKAAKDLQKELAEIAKSGTKAKTSLEQAKKQAEKFAELADPMKKYNRQVREMADAVKRGGLNQQLANKQLAKYREEAERAGQAGKKAFGMDALRRITGITGALGAALAVQRAITAEYRAQAAHAETMGNKALGVAGSQAQFAYNVGTASAQEKEALKAQVMALGPRGVLVPDAYKMVGDTFSITGDVAATVQATNLASQLGQTSEQQQALATGMGQIISKTGFGGLGSVGFAEAFQAQTTVGTQAQAIEALAKVVVGGKGRGGTGVGSGAMLAGFTEGLGDMTGRQSATAVQRFQEELMPFAAQRGLDTSSPWAAYMDVMNQGMGQEFFQSRAWSAETVAGVRAMLDPSSRAYGKAQDVWTAADTQAEREALGRQGLAEADTRVARAGRRDRALAAGVQQRAMKRRIIPLGTEGKANLKTLLMEAYGTNFESIAHMFAEGAEISPQNAANLLDNALNHVRTQSMIAQGAPGVPGGGTWGYGPAPERTPDMRANELVESMQAMREVMESRSVVNRGAE